MKSLDTYPIGGRRARWVNVPSVLCPRRNRINGRQTLINRLCRIMSPCLVDRDGVLRRRRTLILKQVQSCLRIAIARLGYRRHQSVGTSGLWRAILSTYAILRTAMGLLLVSIDFRSRDQGTDSGIRFEGHRAACADCSHPGGSPAEHSFCLLFPPPPKGSQWLLRRTNGK